MTFFAASRFRLSTARGLLALGRRDQRKQLVGNEHVAAPTLVQPGDREHDELRAHIG